ncbi:chaperone TorD involved in molybdoenzyme TorA maturation [Actinomyces denticolens]|uniref:Chaperone TorD involved in molybdoenzyme TorA maturation n=1 Tax=Actinomyces denticolens TaxID=52767 RepID=A0ABY1IC89_9ACTO|nr:molecular chaperone TorD family protein [Actinomyces denticolens]SHI93375.1 chaperone TorD involved in molybdoenzyme TorA maturation [Actinomyces denticolens]
MTPDDARSVAGSQQGWKGAGRRALSIDDLDALAAALGALGRLHLAPASAEERADVVPLLEEWPLDALPVSEETAELARRAKALLAASLADGETQEATAGDQDALYGISRGAIVPPFESVHRGEEGLVFDTHTLQVRQEFRAAGLRAPHLGREPDDHLGLELEFVARCCAAAADSLGGGEAGAAGIQVERARDFSVEHLLVWAPSMLQEAAAHARTNWMRGLCSLTLAALATWVEAAGIEAPAGQPARVRIARRRGWA